MTTTTMTADTPLAAVLDALRIDPGMVDGERLERVLAEHLRAAERRGRIAGLVEFAEDHEALAEREPEGSDYRHDLEWRAVLLRQRAGLIRWPGAPEAERGEDTEPAAGGEPAKAAEPASRGGVNPTVRIKKP